ncbi:MAG TPA: CYTH domain-containing protein [Gammaproteobacteria bacterium]|nr:CYTH domain-containing protein [Gammaproteobacteria bacterium]
MPREIERKFLLKSDAWRLQVRQSQRMSQGYLASGGNVSVRVRIAGAEAWLNIKAGGFVATAMDGGSAGRKKAPAFAARRPSLAVANAGSILRPSRHEYEYPLPLDEARELLALAEGPLIEKTRHLVEQGALTWEIDEFLGDNSGLVVAELELDSEDADFARPPWLGAEVTELRRYYNVCLVTHPYRAWNEAERNP